VHEIYVEAIREGAYTHDRSNIDNLSTHCEFSVSTSAVATVVSTVGGNDPVLCRREYAKWVDAKGQAVPSAI
jgi:hypothetical protein